MSVTKEMCCMCTTNYSSVWLHSKETKNKLEEKLRNVSQHMQNGKNFLNLKTWMLIRS